MAVLPSLPSLPSFTPIARRAPVKLVRPSVRPDAIVDCAAYIDGKRVSVGHGYKTTNATTRNGTMTAASNRVAGSTRSARSACGSARASKAFPIVVHPNCTVSRTPSQPRATLVYSPGRG